MNVSQDVSNIEQVTSELLERYIIITCVANDIFLSYEDNWNQSKLKVDDR